MARTFSSSIDARPRSPKSPGVSGDEDARPRAPLLCGNDYVEDDTPYKLRVRRVWYSHVATWLHLGTAARRTSLT